MSAPDPIESVCCIVLSTVVATSSAFVAIHGYPLWVSLALVAAALAMLAWALSVWRRQQRSRRGTS